MKQARIRQLADGSVDNLTFLVWCFSESPPASPLPFCYHIFIGKNNGFIDKTGEIILDLEKINPDIKHPHSFSEGLSCVYIGNKYGYIDKKGNIVIKPQFDNAEGFIDGLAIVKMGDQKGYIDKKGNYVWISTM